MSKAKGHRKKKPKGQRELDEDVSALQEIISQQQEDGRSIASARSGVRGRAPALNLGDKMKSTGSINDNRRIGMGGPMD